MKKQPITIHNILKTVQESVIHDARNKLMNMGSNDLDIRDKWMGIRRLKSNYQPQPYHRKRETAHTYPETK